MEEAQAAVDAWVAGYNTDRPHQGLDEKVPAVPAQRFAPVPRQQRELVSLWLPATLEAARAPAAAEPQAPGLTSSPASASSARWNGGPVEFDRVVPPSGNMMVARRQFWLGPRRAGLTVTFWASTDIIHLMLAGARIKTLRSHLSAADLAALAAAGGRAAGPEPLPSADPGAAIEVDRTVSSCGA